MENKRGGLLVIGAGLPRTGTLSTRAALQYLLGGPCYHGAVPTVERPDHLEAWVEALEQGDLKLETARWLLEGFRAGVDWPLCCWYNQLAAMHPQAKVLLTVRDPIDWFSSFSHITTSITRLITQPPYSWFFDLVAGKHVANLRKAERIEFGINGEMRKAVGAGQDHAVAFFKDHIKQVKASVPPERLLVFDVKEGWEPLCAFLNLPVPPIPFPKINDRREVQALNILLRGVVWVVLLGLPILLALILQTGSWLVISFAPFLILFVFWAAEKVCKTASQRHVNKSDNVDVKKIY